MNNGAGVAVQTAEMSPVERIRALFDAYAPAHASPWIRRFRRQAMRRFEETGFPTIRQEAWKYTDVRRIAETGFTLGEARQPQEHLLSAGAIEEMDCHRMVFVNGLFNASLSRLDNLPAGVRVASLAGLLETEAPVVQPYLPPASETAGFAALNAAFMRDGACVIVDAGIQMERPIHLYFISDDDGASALAPLMNPVVIGAGGKATVIESYVGEDNASGLTLSETRIDLAAGASIAHYRLQRQGAHAFHVGNVCCRQKEGSRFASYAVALGASLARTDIHARLAGKGASCTLTGMYLTSGRQHVDYHTRIDHEAPDCTSEEYYRGVLSGRSHAVFNGRVIVHEGADGTDARQSNGNLLLSRHAEVDTKPELEIYADDVKCAHGATVGQIDLEQLFYLRSRGLDEASARNVLTYAFADGALARMGLAVVRRHLERAALKHLPQGDELEALV